MKKHSQHYRTVFLSDIHLGNVACRADFLLDFLDNLQCERLYLVGDIVDMLAMKRRLYWPAAHYEVIQKLQQIAKDGCEVLYIPGNHDWAMRDYCGNKLLDVEVHRRYVHETKDGKKLLVIHGDELDHAVIYDRMQRIVGDAAYEIMVFFHRWTNRIRNLFGVPFWSLATYVKTHVKEAKKAIEKFETAAIKMAKDEGMDGIVCGHIHKAELREEHGILYCNDGDWTESCTALIETQSGEMRILHWSDEVNTIKTHAPLIKAA